MLEQKFCPEFSEKIARKTFRPKMNEVEKIGDLVVAFGHRGGRRRRRRRSESTADGGRPGTNVIIFGIFSPKK
jgi:hypothetical protein